MTQVKALCPESLALLQSQQVLKNTVHLLSQLQQLKIHFNALEGSYALCLTANLIHLLHLETVESLGEVRPAHSLLHPSGSGGNDADPDPQHWSAAGRNQAVI